MARRRIIDPEFWLDEEISKLTPHARLFYIGLWGICDDNYATFPDLPGWLKIQIFPYENVDTISLLKELSEARKILKFEFEDQKYWYIKNFFKHQIINRPSRPKYPEFKPYLSHYYQTLTEGSMSTHPEKKRKEKKRSKEENIKKQKNDYLF